MKNRFTLVDLVLLAGWPLAALAAWMGAQPNPDHVQGPNEVSAAWVFITFALAMTIMQIRWMSVRTGSRSAVVEVVKLLVKGFLVMSFGAIGGGAGLVLFLLYGASRVRRLLADVFGIGGGPRRRRGRGRGRVSYPVPTPGGVLQPSGDGFAVVRGARRCGQGVVIGTAGGNVGSGVAKADTSWQTGAVGEMAVGAALEAYVSKHGGTVLHGLNFTPGKFDGTDIDHVVVTERGNIMFFDAKMWPYATYTWGKDLDKFGKPVYIALKDGQHWAGEKIGMPHMIRKWTTYLGNQFVIHGMIVLANDPSPRSGKRYVTPNLASYDAPDRTFMITLDQVEQMITAFDRKTPAYSANAYPDVFVSQLTMAQRSYLAANG